MSGQRSVRVAYESLFPHICFIDDVCGGPKRCRGLGSACWPPRTGSSAADTVEEPESLLHLSALGESERILDVDAEISHGAFDLGMSEQDLHSAQVSGLLVDDRRLGPA